MQAATAAVTALAFRTPASSAGRLPGPSESAFPSTARLLVGTASGSILTWPASSGGEPPPLPLPCRRRRRLPPTPATLTGHVGPVHGLVSGPGGVVASGGADRTVRLWPGTAVDADGGTVLSGHQGAVTALAAVREGWCSSGAITPTLTTLLLSGSADKSARVWTLPADGVRATHVRAGSTSPPVPPARTLAGHHTDWVRAVDLGGGGACCACCGGGGVPALALTGGDDGRAVLWDVEAGSAARVVRVGGGEGDSGGGGRAASVRAVRFLDSGSYPCLFATGDTSGRVTVWDGRDGRGTGVVGDGHHGGPVPALVACRGPSSPFPLVSVGGDGTVRAWDVKGGGVACTGAVDAGLGPLAAAALTPCGGGVVVGGAGGAGRVGLVEVGKTGVGKTGVRGRRMLRGAALSPVKSSACSAGFGVCV